MYIEQGIPCMRDLDFYTLWVPNNAYALVTDWEFIFRRATVNIVGFPHLFPGYPASSFFVVLMQHIHLMLQCNYQQLSIAWYQVRF